MTAATAAFRISPTTVSMLAVNPSRATAAPTTRTCPRIQAPIRSEITPSSSFGPPPPLGVRYRLIVLVENARGHVGPGVFRRCLLPGSFQSGPQIAIGQHPNDAERQRRRVTGLDQDSFSLVFHDGGIAGDVGRHHRFPGCHRLQEDHPETLAFDRRRAENAATRVVAR